MELIKLEKGQPFPYPVQDEEGARAEFIREGSNVLTIKIGSITAKEIQALSKEPIKFGFLYEAGAMLLLFQFYGQDGQPLITFDAPFDVRLIPNDKRSMPDIDNREQRLLVEIYVVDERNILRVIRAATLSPAKTLEFLSAVQDQLLESRKGHNRMAWWMQKEPHDLIKLASTDWMGK